MDFKLDWGSGSFPGGRITFDGPISDTVLLQIPKNIPRTTNLDFGHFGLYALQTDGSELQIKETESECFYILEIPAADSDYIEIFGASVAAGRWEPVSILNQSCGEFSLKQQIENKMTALEIECQNERYVLVERSNARMACVYHSTSDKLGWKIIGMDSNPASSAFKVAKGTTTFDVEYSLTERTVQDITYDADTNVMLITMDATGKGILTINLPRDLIMLKWTTVLHRGKVLLTTVFLSWQIREPMILALDTRRHSMMKFQPLLKAGLCTYPCWKMPPICKS